MSIQLRNLATFIVAGALLASTSVAAAAPAWPADLAKLPYKPAGKTLPLPTGVSGYAVVRASDATVQFGSNAIGAQHVGPGFFAVQFNSDVSRCAYAVTFGDPVA